EVDASADAAGEARAAVAGTPSFDPDVAVRVQEADAPLEVGLEALERQDELPVQRERVGLDVGVREAIAGAEVVDVLVDALGREELVQAIAAAGVEPEAVAEVGAAGRALE